LALYSQLSNQTSDVFENMIYTCLILFFVFHCIPRFIEIRFTKKNIDNSDFTNKKKEITFNEESIIVLIYDSEEKKYPFKCFYRETNKNFQIIFSNSHQYIIPKNNFKLRSEYSQFKKLFLDKKKEKKNLFNNPITNKIPPYFIGILGFIPIWGTIVSLSMIIYNQFKYKDLLFFICGLVGLIFNIWFYFKFY